MDEEQGGAGAATFVPRANVAMLAVGMGMEAAAIGVAATMLFVRDGHWAWWILLAFGLLIGPGALLKYLSAARCRGDADQLHGYMGKGFGAVPWGEVQSVVVQAARLRVTGPAGTIIVNLAYLTNRDELMAYVRGRCEAHGIQHTL